MNAIGYRYVKTWFNQAGKKKSRRTKRLVKAQAIAPRPVAGLLRPVVHCQTIRYNARVRAGRGFTLDELKVILIDSSSYVIVAPELCLWLHYCRSQSRLWEKTYFVS